MSKFAAMTLRGGHPSPGAPEAQQTAVPYTQRETLWALCGTHQLQGPGVRDRTPWRTRAGSLKEAQGSSKLR